MKKNVNRYASTFANGSSVVAKVDETNHEKIVAEIDVRAAGRVTVNLAMVTTMARVVKIVTAAPAVVVPMATVGEKDIAAPDTARKALVDQAVRWGAR